VLGLVLGAAGISVCWPMLLAHASQGVGATAGVVSGMTAIGYLGFVLGPAVIGLLAGINGLRTALLVLAAVAVVVAVTPRFLRPVGQTG
jgi:MFS family permease